MRQGLTGVQGASRSVIELCHRVKSRFRPWPRSVFGRPYTSGALVTVTEEVTSPTTFGGSQDVMIVVTWTSQVTRLWQVAMAGGSVS